MADLSLLEKYTDIDASFYIDLANKDISKSSFSIWFDNQLMCFLDCSKTLPNGDRVIQTNFIHYKKEITTILQMIDDYAIDKNYFYERLLCQHKANLNFEAINGLPYDVKETTKKKPIRKRNKQTSIVELDKPKKETAAERKLKAHIAKISSLNIKIKPVRNDNAV